MPPTAADIRREVSALRKRDIDRYVAARINRVEGDCSVEDINAWERDAYMAWRTEFPALNSLLIPHAAVL